MVVEQGNGKPGYLEGKLCDFCNTEPQKTPIASRSIEGKKNNSARIERWLNDSSTKC